MRMNNKYGAIGELIRHDYTVTMDTTHESRNNMGTIDDHLRLMNAIHTKFDYILFFE